MEHHDDFDSVSWRNDLQSDGSPPTTAGTDVGDHSRVDRDVNGKRRMSTAHE
jgi:sorting nexin-4